MYRKIRSTANFSSRKSCPRTCFVAGTLVHTKTGMVPIEDIQVGDEVLATNPETSQQSYKKVLTKFVRKADRIYQLLYENGTVIETTWSHRFFIRNTGWIMAKDLWQGDVSVTSDGRVLKIDRVVVDTIYETVYNLEVESEHNFFVSNDGVLVHNENRYKKLELIINESASQLLQLDKQIDTMTSELAQKCATSQQCDFTELNKIIAKKNKVLAKLDNAAIEQAKIIKPTKKQIEARVKEYDNGKTWDKATNDRLKTLDPSM